MRVCDVHARRIRGGAAHCYSRRVCSAGGEQREQAHGTHSRTDSRRDGGHWASADRVTAETIDTTSPQSC